MIETLSKPGAIDSRVATSTDEYPIAHNVHIHNSVESMKKLLRLYSNYFTGSAFTGKEISNINHNDDDVILYNNNNNNDNVNLVSHPQPDQTNADAAEMTRIIRGTISGFLENQNKIEKDGSGVKTEEDLEESDNKNCLKTGGDHLKSMEECITNYMKVFDYYIVMIKKTVVDTLKRANTELTTPSFCDPIVNFRQTDKHMGMHDDEKDKPAAISSYGISVKEGNKINGSKPKHLVMVNHQGGQEAVKKSSKKRSYRNVDVKNTPSSPSPKKKTNKSKSNSKSLKAVFVPSSSLSNHNTNNTFASKLEKTMQKGSEESLIFAHYMSSMYDSKMKESIDSTMEGSNHHHSLITNNSDHSLLPSFYSSERDYIGFATDNGSIHDYSYTRSSMNISSDDNNKNPKEYLPRLFSDAFSSYEQTQGTLCDQNTHINDNFHKADDTALNPDCKSDKVLEHTESHVNSLLIDSPRTSCNNLPFHSGDTNIRIHSSADNLSAQLSPNQYHCEIPGDHIMMARPQTATLADIDASAMSAYTKLLCDDRACGNINPDEDIMAMDVRKDGVVMKEDSLDCQRSSMAKIARCLYYDDEGGYETKVNHFVSVQRPIPKRSGPPRPIVQENCSDAEKNLNGVVDELYLLGNSNLN